MRAKEVHAVLNRELGPTMKAMGFQRTGSATASWRQSVNLDGADPRHLFVATHIARVGFDEHNGGWFILELWIGSTPSLVGPVKGNFASYFDFLAPQDKQRLLALVNQARVVIPAYQGLPPERQLNTDALYYYNDAHVTAYARVLRGLLPHIITLFAEIRDFPTPPQVLEAL